MIERAYNETSLLFVGAFMQALKLTIMIIFSILRVVGPIVLVLFLLLFKGSVLFTGLMLVSIWEYWKNISLLNERLQHFSEISNIVEEMRQYCFAPHDELTDYYAPFSVECAVKNTRFYRYFFAFIDDNNTPYGYEEPLSPITIQNFMSQGWLTLIMDKGLTIIAKGGMTLGFLACNSVFVILFMLRRLFN